MKQNSFGISLDQSFSGYGWGDGVRGGNGDGDEFDDGWGDGVRGGKGGGDIKGYGSGDGFRYGNGNGDEYESGDGGGSITGRDEDWDNETE